MQQPQQNLKPLFSFAFLTSIAPFAVYALISTFGHTLFNQNHEILSSKILLKIKSLILQGYSSFLSFSLMMLALNVIYRVSGKIILKKFDLVENVSPLPMTHQKENHPKRITYQRRLFTALFYGIIFLSFRFLGLFPDDISQAQLTLKTTDPFIGNGINGILTTRVLEQEQEEESFALTQSRQASDLKTISIGRVLSFLNINPTAILLSKTSKIAFVITKYSGGLKLIDISDPQYPTIIGSLDLTSIDNQFQIKTLKLSADEKTLFATTTECLEIINVTNPQAPSLISFFKDPAIPSQNVPFYFIPTLALPPDETTLYVAGIGLQIFNITNTSRPKLLFSARSPQTEGRLAVTSLALLPGGKTLGYANGTLDFYDVSDPTSPKRINAYKAKSSITSIALSKDNQTVYAAGSHFEFKEITMLEKINIIDPLSPQSLHYMT